MLNQSTFPTHATYNDDAHPIGVAQEDFAPFGDVFGLYFVVAVLSPKTCHLRGCKAVRMCHQECLLPARSDGDVGNNCAQIRLTVVSHAAHATHAQG